MNNIPAKSYPLRTKDTAYKTIMDEIILLNLHNGFYYSANEVGSRIWDLCDGTRTINELSTILSEEYDISIDQASADLREFIEDMHREGLITFDDKPA